MTNESTIRATHREREDAVEGLRAAFAQGCLWSRRAGHWLGRGGGLLLTATGAWLIAVAAGGVAAVPLIFLWLVALRLCGRLSRR